MKIAVPPPIAALGFLALLAFALYLAATAFAQPPRQEQLDESAPGNVMVLEGRLTPEPLGAPTVSMGPLVESGVVDMAALDIRPLPVPLASGTPDPVPLGAAVTTGNAFLSISPEIGNINTVRAFVMVGANFTPGEDVVLSINGSFVTTFQADAAGRVNLSQNTGAGFGFTTVRLSGLTSLREAAGVFQVANTGPYLTGVAIGPHAINPTGTSTINIMGRGYPPSTAVTIRRNGTSLGIPLTTNPDGGFSATLTVAPAANGSAVYSVDSGTPGSLVGQSIEERTDAGAPPLGDQNVARAFVDRAVLDSALGGTVAVVGEGFQVGEIITVSGCASTLLPADANNAAAFFVNFPPGAGSSTCTISGGTSGRVARATVLLDPSVTNIRGLIVAPAFTLPNDATVTVLADRLPTNDLGTIFLDGVMQGTSNSDASGRGTFTLTKPTTSSVHAVGWVTASGDAQSAVLFLGPPGPTPTPSPGFCVWSASPVYPIPIRNAAVSSVGANLYSFGGTTTGDVGVADSFRFDGTTWTPIAPLPSAFPGSVAVTDGTNIYLVTGATLRRYNPGANTYTTLAPPTVATGGHAAAYLAGKIYKFAGVSTNALEIYDISLNQWTAGANYPVSGYYNVRAFGHGNFIYGVGGTNPVPIPLETSATYRYDPATNTWDDAAIANLPGVRAAGAVASYNGSVVYAGGSSNAMVLASAISWNPTSNTWSSLPFMLAQRTEMYGAALNGNFYVVGGRAQSSSNNNNQRLTCAPGTSPTPTPTPPFTPTPTPTPTLTPTPTPTLSPTPPPTPTPTPTPTLTPPPTPTPTPTPSISPSKLLNIATRMRVQTGENVLIGGFIITGTDSKNVIIRGIGPSLSSFFSGVLANPTLELFQGDTLLQSNNDWKDTQRTEIEATGLQPSNDLESAIVRTITPGAYTAVVRGNGNTSGIGVVEAYDLNQAANSKLANIATRGFVEAGDNVMIGGLIIGPGAASTARVVVRAIGPSLTGFGVAGALQDPTVDLKDVNGTTLMSNNDWEQGQPTEIQQLGLAPTDPRESALVTTLTPGAFTAIVRGVGGTTGVALVEVYHVQ